MDWSNERYVRVFTRDTADLMAVGWQGRLVWYELLRRADRSGVIDTGDDLDALPELLRVPPEVFVVGFPKLVRRRCVTICDGYVVVPNFVEAQEANQSGAQRKRDSRERRRTQALRGDLSRSVTYTVTVCDGSVTRGHTQGHEVTPSLAVPSLAKRTLSIESTSSPPAATEKSLGPGKSHSPHSEAAAPAAEEAFQNREGTKEARGEDGGEGVRHSGGRTSEPVRTQNRASSKKARIKLDFDKIYQAYPRKQGKKVGLAKLKARVKTRELYDEVLVAVERLAVDWAGADQTFLPHFSTWVNQERWRDDEPLVPVGPGAKKLTTLKNLFDPDS